MSREDPFGGDWKLNPKKSQFDANHRPSSASMHWERTSEGYRMTAEGTMGDGKVCKERPATFILDGVEHDSPDQPGFSEVSTRLAHNLIEVESKRSGSIIGKASYVVSGNGTTLTASVSGIGPHERSFQTVTVWDRL